MSSTFSGLSIAISGLYTNKKSLDVTSHNISNVNNPGYVRQQAIHSSARYSTTANGGLNLGSGVNLQEIRQLRDEFLDLKFRSEADSMGYWSAKNSVFEEVQSIFNEISNSGLQKVMDQFWDGWQELSKDADNLTIRGLLQERAIAFTESVNHISNQLDNLQINLNREIENKVSEINNIAKEIATLNEKILAVENKEGKANDYRDARNNLLDRLSSLVSIEYYEDSKNVVNVSIGGKYIVKDRFYTEMSAEKNGSTFVELFWKDGAHDRVDIKGGELLGYLEARGDVAGTILGNGNGSVDTNVKVHFATTGSADETQIVNNFKADMTQRGLNTSDTNGSFAGSLSDLITYIENDTSLQGDGHKQLVIFANSDITGINDSDIKKLKNLGVSITAIAHPSSNWGRIAAETGGSLFNSSEVSSDPQEQMALARGLARETSGSVSLSMGSTSSFSEIIPTIKQKLNALVNTITRSVNYFHRQGYDLDGTTGVDFFVAMNSSKPMEAGNIKINDALFNLNKIAVSSNPIDTTNERGNGKIAELISGIRDEYIFKDMNSDDFYRGIISDIGVAGNEASTMELSQQILVSQIDGKRQSLSAVSLDEEMTDMIKYQHSYVANSRVVNAIDEMIENIINRMGVVGR